MKRDWQNKRDYLRSTLKTGVRYDIFSHNTHIINGIYEKYEKGRYFFKYGDSIYNKVNLHKLRGLKVVEDKSCGT